uniref:Uncharacterized protein n=1 Tax=Propithecus coquereli TaxID=379532 RepID=A0A2K6GQI9_PROCO
ISWRQMTSEICAFQPAQLALLAPYWLCYCKVLPPLLTLPLLGH